MTDLPIQSAGESADGTLRFEQRLGETRDGRYDGRASVAVLIDAASGAVLADCSAWTSSGIIPRPDGSLYLRTRVQNSDALFRIDPARRRFRDLGERGSDRPLGELATALEEARQALGHRAAPIDTDISPDGRIRVDRCCVEWSNSHWVCSPQVTELESGRVLLDLADDWDASASFPRDGVVRLGLRRYAHGGFQTVEIDIDRETYRIFDETGQDEPLPEAPLSGIDAGLEASSRRAARAAAALARSSAPVRALRPAPFAAWRGALLILIGATIAIAAGTMLSLSLSRPPAQQPTPLPAVPHQ